MYKLPIIISSVLLVIVVVACAYLLKSSQLTLTDAQLVSSVITLFTCLQPDFCYICCVQLLANEPHFPAWAETVIAHPGDE